jgi:hypothetical protein
MQWPIREHDPGIGAATEPGGPGTNRSDARDAERGRGSRVGQFLRPMKARFVGMFVFY